MRGQPITAYGFPRWALEAFAWYVRSMPCQSWEDVQTLLLLTGGRIRRSSGVVVGLCLTLMDGSPRRSPGRCIERRGMEWNGDGMEWPGLDFAPTAEACCIWPGSWGFGEGDVHPSKLGSGGWDSGSGAFSGARPSRSGLGCLYPTLHFSLPDSLRDNTADGHSATTRESTRGPCRGAGISLRPHPRRRCEWPEPRD
jgi:hypothetical protein